MVKVDCSRVAMVQQLDLRFTDSMHEKDHYRQIGRAGRNGMVVKLLVFADHGSL